MTDNPFVTSGYAGPEYCCDRVEETQTLVDLLTNGNNVALQSYLQLSSDTYEALLCQMPEKQRNVFLVIASERRAKAISSAAFVKKYNLPSASSVVSAIKGLVEKDFVTHEKNEYYVYDLFFQLWIEKCYWR